MSEINKNGQIIHSFGLCTLQVWPERDNCADEAVQFVENAVENAEAEYQLLEGTRYYYEFDGPYCFDEKSDQAIVKYIPHKSAISGSFGVINTKLYVGTIALRVLNSDGAHVSSVRFEIRSRKLDYRTDYHRMLEDITRDYAELVMQPGAPVTQSMEIKENANATTLYQRFAFMRSIVESETFNDALHRIMASPVRKWQETIAERRICNLRRIGRKEVRQLFTAVDRISCDFPLPDALSHSLPRRIMVSDKCDTINNSENQFVKYVLYFFNGFCEDLRSKLSTKTETKRDNTSVERLKREIDCTTRRIDNFLNTNFFKAISLPSHLNLNSPVLQRKEGYREVLQAWVFFDLAAKLSWNGGEKVYEAGKRNVAALYEYWCFFKLLDVVKNVFKGKCDTRNLVTSDDKKFSLNLKQGNQLMITGTHVIESKFHHLRKINYALYYNRTFKRIKPKQDNDGEHSSYERAGSWSVQMRPDYTLSMWPSGFSVDDAKNSETDFKKLEAEAEKNDLIVHIHFDAKYRVESIIEQSDIEFSDDEACDEDDGELVKKKEKLEEEKLEEASGIYKRGDILKMHAYRDAIRRSTGAYVLYPGDKTTKLRGFREIIPGLGAFCLRPGDGDDGTNDLLVFIQNVCNHFIDQLPLPSQREQMAYYTHMVYTSGPRNVITIENHYPEKSQIILFGNCSDITKINKRYCFRIGSELGDLTLDEDVYKADYLVVYDNRSHKVFMLNRNLKPSLHTGLELIGKQYYANIHPSNAIDSMHVYCIFSLGDECSDVCINGLVDEYMKNEQAPHPTLLSTIAFYADGRILISESEVIKTNELREEEQNHGHERSD